MTAFEDREQVGKGHSSKIIDRCKFYNYINALKIYQVTHNAWAVLFMYGTLIKYLSSFTYIAKQKYKT